MKKVQIVIFIMISSIITGCVQKTSNSPAPKTIQKTESKPSKVYFCPKPRVIVKNKKNIEGFADQNLSWSINNQGFKIPKHIAFVKAVIAKYGDNLSCYYQWPNSKKPGTSAWTIVDLNPEVNQKIHHYGVHWAKTTPEISMCNSGAVKTCGFTLK